MAAKTYTVYNGALPGAAALVQVTTGTAIKTMFQVLTLAGVSARVVQWWTEFDGSAAATPIKVELLGHTGGPQTTLTTYAATDCPPANDPNAPRTALSSLACNTSGFGTRGAE